MSFLSDLVGGNWDNLGHDLSADPWGTAAGVGAAAATIAAPFTFGASLPLAAELGGVAAGGATLGEAGLGLAAGAEGLTEGGLAVTGAEGASGLFGGAAADTLGSGFSWFGGPQNAYAGMNFPATGLGESAAQSAFTLDPTYSANFGGQIIGETAPTFQGSVGTFNPSQIPTSELNTLAGYGPGTGTDLATLGPSGTTGGAAGDMTALTGPGGGPGGASAGTQTSGDIFSRISGWATSNPLQAAGLGVAAGGLAYNLLQGGRTDPNLARLQGNADQMGAQARGLMDQGVGLQQYLQNGTLPPAMQAQMTQAVAAARARIISTHASRGLPTNPAQNSMLAQELNSLDLQALVQAGQLEENLFKSGSQLLQLGVQETGMSNALLAQLYQFNRQESQDTGKAITNFAAALGGMNRGINLRLG